MSYSPYAVLSMGRDNSVDVTIATRPFQIRNRPTPPFIVVSTQKIGCGLA
jgi:hypothetical protein